MEIKKLSHFSSILAIQGLLSNIGTFLRGKDLARGQQVCKSLLVAFGREELWENLCNECGIVAATSSRSRRNQKLFKEQYVENLCVECFSPGVISFKTLSDSPLLHLCQPCLHSVQQFDAVSARSKCLPRFKLSLKNSSGGDFFRMLLLDRIPTSKDMKRRRKCVHDFDSPFHNDLLVQRLSAPQRKKKLTKVKIKVLKSG